MEDKISMDFEFFNNTGIQHFESPFEEIKNYLFLNKFDLEDDPKSMTNPFQLNNLVPTFIYYIRVSRKDQNEFFLCLLTPTSFGDLTNYKMEFNSCTTAKVENFIRNEIPIDFFYFCYEFSKDLIADLKYMTKNEMKTSFFEFNDIFKDGLIRNYIFAPCKIVPPQNLIQIDWITIEEYLKYKQKTTFDTSQWQNEYNQQISKIDQNYYLTQKIFSTVYGNQMLYCILRIIPIENTTAFTFLEQYFELIGDIGTIEELAAKFNLSIESSKLTPLKFLLYEHQSELQNVMGLRNLEKYSIKVNQNSPIALCQRVPNINHFDYLNPTSQNINKIKIGSQKFRGIQLIPCEFLTIYPFNTNIYEHFTLLPAITISIERAIVANEMASYYKLKGNISQLIKSTNTPSYDSKNNYEVLETLGDSVLKFITSFELFHKFKLDNESLLTSKRSKIICNNNLALKGFKMKLQTFIKVYKKKFNQWKHPLIKEVQEKQKKTSHKVDAKNIADSVEALLGAVFSLYYECSETFVLLNKFNLLEESKIKDIYFESFIFEDLNLLSLYESQILLRTSFKGLYKLSSHYFQNCKKIYKTKKIKINFSESKIIESKLFFSKVLYFTRIFEREYLGYNFHNKKYLIKAFTIRTLSNGNLRENYERQEFLGDAIIETLIVSNVFKLFDEEGISFTPETLQIVKICFLSNYFMSSMVLFLGWHRFIMNLKESEIYEINKNVEEFQTTKLSFNKFIQVKKNNLSKILSDVWESIAAAILLDGGISAFVSIYGRILTPYIIYFFKFYKKMFANVIGLLKLTVETKMLTTFEIKDNFENKEYKSEIFIGGKFVCSSTANNKKESREQACLNALKEIKYFQ